ncbi:OmpA family protein [Polynucleobacter sp. IMCC30063]|uniref:OmpA/MotB family protein n=1 Tax=unclassified Polynucleobacter TaxID=2640945 RepID=UPI001F26A1D9|nr:MULTISPECIES: OmpA family protein [unclassified Polynucleobacter]MCE7506231.1 OmpA family protein [Polynucleobacter sp. IMCC30063]MCE7527501.1 OmpA family protein [Polynucleobacter sp. IMCC 30228]MCE7530457.1 OmpA family protein [Polynucleobacter sp. IMCC 29146]
MNLLQKYLLLICTASLGLLAGCVTQQSYNQLDGAYSQLQQAFQGDEVEIRKLQGELRITIKDKILFPEGGYRLNSKADAVLAKMAPTLSGFKNTKVVVRGYTDNVPIGAGLKKEGIETNLDLSSRRADNVVDYLIKKGVSPGLISAQGMGEASPMAPNDTADGRAQNRRIEVTLVGPGT